jgi:hypothetical protein
MRRVRPKHIGLTVVGTISPVRRGCLKIRKVRRSDRFDRRV